MTDPVDLKTTQQDYAIFLPAISTFYSTFIGRQRSSTYVDPARIPSGFSHGVESLNFLDPQKSVFHYPWALYSAGHAVIDLKQPAPKEDMFRQRVRNGDNWILGDSGGFQIGKGVWEGDWKDPTCPKAQAKREQVLSWMDGLMDYGMILDIPAWVSRSPRGQEATGIHNYQEAVDATRINNDYFIKNRTGACKFLNVLQGETHTEAEDWYQQVKDYCDPKQYSNHFNGWSMGGQNMCDVHLVLKRLVALRFDGLLEKGVQDWMHFLGTSKLEWAVMLTDIQRAVRKHHNENFTISFDCASPFLANANGLIYTYTRMLDRAKWTYKMETSADNKKYSTDTRMLGDVLRDDKIVGGFDSKGNPIAGEQFLDGPITNLLQVKDICVYKPGDLNKIGKEGRTSWDSFSYALQMGHNVWAHINAVQEANKKYDTGIIPGMLVDERFDRIMFRDIVEQVFSTSDRTKAEEAVEEWNSFYLRIPGTRGAVGKKTINAKTSFNAMFTVEQPLVKNAVVIEDEYVMDESKLEDLENVED